MVRLHSHLSRLLFYEVGQCLVHESLLIPAAHDQGIEALCQILLHVDGHFYVPVVFSFECFFLYFGFTFPFAFGIASMLSRAIRMSNILFKNLAYIFYTSRKTAQTHYLYPIEIAASHISILYLTNG